MGVERDERVLDVNVGWIVYVRRGGMDERWTCSKETMKTDDGGTSHDGIQIMLRRKRQ